MGRFDPLQPAELPSIVRVDGERRVAALAALAAAKGG
jgi:hypothetical protein